MKDQLNPFYFSHLNDMILFRSISYAGKFNENISDMTKKFLEGYFNPNFMQLQIYSLT